VAREAKRVAHPCSNLKNSNEKFVICMEETSEPLKKGKNWRQEMICDVIAGISNKQ